MTNEAGVSPGCTLAVTNTTGLGVPAEQQVQLIAQPQHV